jgi:hypothetical protein
VTARRGRRRKQILDDLKETGVSWELKEEALDRTQWRTGVGRGCGPVVQRISKHMNIRSWTERNVTRVRAALIFYVTCASMLCCFSYLGCGFRLCMLTNKCCIELLPSCELELSICVTPKLRRSVRTYM